MSENVLLEIGTEEIPHEVLTPALRYCEEKAAEKLAASGVSYGKLSVYGTPRRIAFYLENTAPLTKAKTVEKKGPAVKAAFDASGAPTRALQGFLDSSKAQLSQTVRKDIGGNEYVYLVIEEEGRNIVDVLPQVFTEVLTTIEFPRTMKWGSSEFRFVRPIKWITSLAGSRVMPFQLGGVSAGASTTGHRQSAGGPAVLKNAADYLHVLRGLSVLADPAERRDSIKKMVETEAASLKCRALLTDSLLDTLVNLVENPHVVTGTFEEAFLPLPKEVLVSEMVEHQKYVPLEKEDGSLSNKFLIVTNVPGTPLIVAGNERVIRARFNDGRFFFDEDRKHTLESRLPRMESVVYAKGLGSMADKVARIEKLTSVLAGMIGLETVLTTALRAARLCKADLMSSMVGEFPELQGAIGYYYALNDGENINVAITVREHYWPRFSGDRLPSLPEGVLVSLADRIDNLFAMYSRGLYVTGSKDPFALRRQTLGIIRILIENRIHLDFTALFQRAFPLYESYLSVDKKEYEQKILQFLTTRVQTVFKEYGFNYDEIDAGITADVSDIYDSYLRIKAINTARGSEAFRNLTIAFKRVKNILKGQKMGDCKADLFREKEEKDLFALFTENALAFTEALEGRDYGQAVGILTSFRPRVDAFFDKILVMDKDEAVKNNRVSLLASIDSLFAKFINFEKIVTE